MKESLPIDAVLPKVAAQLEAHPNVVVLAEPGAGKTTRLPQLLLDCTFRDSGQNVLVLEPRRLAARLAAERIAKERQVKVGDEVGYHIRFAKKSSERTRIVFLTEGILVKRVQQDPELSGIGAVILDEFHERSIHADLAIAFLREVQETIRSDLRIIVMSATLDPGPVSSFLGDCPVVHAKGRVYPLEVHWLERPDPRPIPELVAHTIKKALGPQAAAGQGDLLAFLPGVSEIRRTQGLLEAHAKRIEVCPLYGDLPKNVQDRAVQGGKKQKVILATNIAESSLTIPGVRTVVDSGWARILRYDPSRGLDRLELVRIGTHSADQRAGRAARTGPGRVFRLWTEKEHRLLKTDSPPEIMRTDLAPLVMEVIRFSSRDPRKFGWFEAPPAAHVARAEDLLRKLGAMPPDGHALTTLGEALSAFPLHPRLAKLLVCAWNYGVLEQGALLAAIVQERDVFRGAQARQNLKRGYGSGLVASSDLLVRLEEIERMARACRPKERFDAESRALGNVLVVRDRLKDLAFRTLSRRKGSHHQKKQHKDAKMGGADEEALLRVVLAGYPDRVGKRSPEKRSKITMAEGGTLELSSESVVQEGALLVAVDVDAGDRRTGGRGRIRMASQIEAEWLRAETGGLQTQKVVRFDRNREAVEGVSELRYGNLLIQESRWHDPDPEQLSEALAAAAEQALDRALPLTDEDHHFLNRHRFFRESMPELDVSPLTPDSRKDLLGTLCQGARSFKDLRKVQLRTQLLAEMPMEHQRALKKHAPEWFTLPSKKNVRLRYGFEGPPVLSVRLQQAFGMYETPRVAAGKVPIKVELLAPNMRPVQITQDLASFWSTTYHEVRKELRRRYPKHAWPEKPSE